MSDNILDDIFNTSEQDVETFMDVIGDSVQIKTDEFAKLFSDKAHQVSDPKLSAQQMANIQIEHGWHGVDYVWHINSHPKRPFKISQERLVYSIAKVMNKVIPDHIVVNVFTPLADWDIKEYTFKAMDLKSEWSIGDSNIEKLNLELFEVLNTLT